MDPTKMMSRRFRRYRGGEDVYGVPPTNEPPKPGMFSSFKIPDNIVFEEYFSRLLTII